MERAVEKEGVKEELVRGLQERAKEGTVSQEDVKKENVEDIAKQPVMEKGGLFCKLRELKKRISSHLLCIS